MTARLWANWHIRALNHIGPDDQWIQTNILARLPCGECKGHATVYMIDNYPRWDDYFAWTVEFHNEINRRLAKPQTSIEQARAKWLTEQRL